MLCVDMRPVLLMQAITVALADVVATLFVRTIYRQCKNILPPQKTGSVITKSSFLQIVVLLNGDKVASENNPFLLRYPRFMKHLAEYVVIMPLETKG